MTNSNFSKEIEAALIIPVPEVEPFVSDLRNRYDPSAAIGVPAHITINYPFIPYMNRPQGVHEELNMILSGFSQFTFRLAEIRTFPHVVYLSPQPTEPFISLINAITHHFTDSPPYKGEFAQPIPHLTIAQVEEDEIIYIKEELAKRVGSLLPLPAIARELWLMENSENIWKKRHIFPLKSF